MKNKIKKYMYNAVISQPDARDWKEKTFTNKKIVLPPTFNVNDRLKRARKQEQGSCVAQTLAGIKESQEFVDIGIKEYHSPQFIYNHRINQGFSGMYLRDGCKILKNIGSVFEVYYPYMEERDVIPECEHLLKEAKRFRISGYYQVDTIKGCKEGVYKHGGAMIGVPVYNHGTRMWKPRKDERIRGYHAMMITGWDDDGFIIRNSWGNDWGDDGYTHMSWDDWDSVIECRVLIDADSDKLSLKERLMLRWKNWNLWIGNNQSIGIFILMGAAFVLGAIFL